MKLPGADRSFIEPAKVRDYLLSSSHPVGRFKATFFRSLGYSKDHWDQLAADLRQIALDSEATPAVPNQFGNKFVVRGILNGSAKKHLVVSVWIILNHEDFPRFVTAYPSES